MTQTPSITLLHSVSRLELVESHVAARGPRGRVAGGALFSGPQALWERTPRHTALFSSFCLHFRYCANQRVASICISSSEVPTPTPRGGKELGGAGEQGSSLPPRTPYSMTRPAPVRARFATALVLFEGPKVYLQHVTFGVGAKGWKRAGRGKGRPLPPRTPYSVTRPASVCARIAAVPVPFNMS